MINRIPKIIHYCWFSGEDIPPFLKSCMNTWQALMPDYQIKVWDSKSFDFSSIPFVNEAYKAKKWAFVADYIRIYALYTEGGIYLDTDVEVFKGFDEFLQYDFFTSHEFHPGNFTDIEKAKLNYDFLPKNKQEYIFGSNVQAAILGAKKGNLYLKDCLDFYSTINFYRADGSLQCEELIIGPIISKIAENYGYRYNQERQLLANNMIVYEPDIFVGNSVFLTNNSYAIHLCNGHWRDKNSYEKFYFSIRNHFLFIFPLFNFLDKAFRKISRLVAINKI